MLGNIRARSGNAPLRQRCHRCRGFGRSACEFCSSTGRVQRGVDRLGQPQFERCTGCFGTRTNRCARCGGEGFIDVN